MSSPFGCPDPCCHCACTSADLRTHIKHHHLARWFPRHSLVRCTSVNVDVTRADSLCKQPSHLPSAREYHGRLAAACRPMEADHLGRNGEEGEKEERAEVGAPADRGTNSSGCCGGASRGSPTSKPRRFARCSSGEKTGSWRTWSREAERARKKSGSTDATSFLCAAFTSTFSWRCWREPRWQGVPAGAAPPAVARFQAVNGLRETNTDRRWSKWQSVSRPAAGASTFDKLDAEPKSRITLPINGAAMLCWAHQAQGSGPGPTGKGLGLVLLDAFPFCPCCEQSSPRLGTAGELERLSGSACAANLARGQRQEQGQRQG